MQDMGKCQGTTAAGTPCKRNATQGEYCRSHSPKDKQPKTRARPPELDGIPDHERAFALSCMHSAELASRGAETVAFTELADLCLLSAANPMTKDSVRVQWVRAAMENIKLHKDEQVRLAEAGSGHTFTYTYVAPQRELDTKGPVDEKEIH